MDQYRIISNIQDSFEKFALSDIKRTQEANLPIAAFILCTCFIDQVSGYAYENNQPGQKTNSDRSKKFIRDYINRMATKSYNDDELVDLLRNKLVHNYSLGDTRIPNHRHYVLEYINPDCHLYEEDNKVYINLTRFISDIENGWQLYKSELSSNIELQRIAIDHYNIYGILGFEQIELTIP